ncbi:hypothetical protein DFP72DRAFT_561120 [Ephemerocybe angulata]|uniref:Cyclin N-terminal domain-containing protein n=1 Tax=Ephemerocybe angulata TaxID=980116 RepID=A0A8H6ICK3_9AGAR|nr:hypothetical protein DFP72DRAFT_561120 [Tulosesus angulatus]
MPVPVPRVVKTIAHPVIKNTRGTDQTPQFSGIPDGNPPSLPTREEWLNSLPHWRRSKPRRIWEDDARLPEQGGNQDFFQGLAVAGNAMAIKGPRAQACLPPLAEIQRPSQVSVIGDKSSMMRHPYSAVGGHWEQDGTAMCDADDALMVIEDEYDAAEVSPNLSFSDLASYESRTYARGPYSPDDSPGTDSGPDTESSPLEPITPFADFIDRAVAAEQPYVSEGNNRHFVIEPSLDYGNCKEEKVPVFPTLAEPAKEVAPAPPPDVVTPSATAGYKKLAEPVSEWLATYVWKVCTTGLSLPALFRYPSGRVVQYTSTPPAYLAPSIHSLLLSTLLQPSAIFLSLWYIVRLPIFFNAAELGPGYEKDSRFRQALLGDTHTYERDNLELNAPFRVFVLGCMLANKWLDDHTFSNKTWHTISNIPIQVLNRLEMLALDVFAYDLTISPRDWNQWMVHLKSYHLSLASPHLQPISRPSSNPHSIIRKAIDEILQAPTTGDPGSPIPQPVFLGIEERKQEKIEAQAAAFEVQNIDLDEDGPLREEYLPRRRSNVSSTNNLRISRSSDSENLHCGSTAVAKPLPPPAKWSPEADEPILRDRNRSSGQYVAVQPTNPYPYTMAYRAPEVVYSQSWDASSFAGPFKAYPAYSYGQPPATMNAAQYYPPPSMATMTHSRSQSLFYDSEHPASRNHLRSFSQQARFDYKARDVRVSSRDYLPAYETEPRWTDNNPYIYGGPYAAPLAGPAW